MEQGEVKLNCRIVKCYSDNINCSPFTFSMHILGLVLNYSLVNVASVWCRKQSGWYSKTIFKRKVVQYRIFYLFIYTLTVSHSVGLSDWSRQSAIGLFSNAKSFLHYFF